MKHLFPAIALMLTATLPAHAQQFTTAAEVRPILEATKANWIALREWEGEDLLYFTHLEAWRCGLSEIRYAVNGAVETTLWPVEPCYTDTAQPNAIAADDRAPYTSFSLDSVDSILIELVYDDGETAREKFTRAAVLMP